MDFINLLSMRNINQSNDVVFLNKTATGTGTAYNVSQFRYVGFNLDTTNSASLTLKCQVSMAPTQPDFTASQGYTNQWAYAEVQNVDDHSLVAGSTGIVLTGSDVHQMYQVVPVGPFRWICFTITARAAGTVNLSIMGATDTLS